MKRRHLVFLPVWIIPVLLIAFGSLINFHQHKIWDKQLLPHSVLTPRDKIKVLNIDQAKTFSVDFVSPDAVTSPIPVISANHAAIPLCNISHHHWFRFATGLRAPPSAFRG